MPLETCPFEVGTLGQETHPASGQRQRDDDTVDERQMVTRQQHRAAVGNVLSALDGRTAQDPGKDCRGPP